MMKHYKKIVCAVVAFFAMSLVAPHYVYCVAPVKKAVPGSALTKHGKKKTVKKKRKAAKPLPGMPRSRRAMILVSPPDRYSVDNMPSALELPATFVDALKKGKIDTAARILRMEPGSLKSHYLLSEMERIQMAKVLKIDMLKKRHSYYQNLGIAYHNLYLYMKGQGIDQRTFYSKAMADYKRSEKFSPSIEHTNEMKILMAALAEISGNTKQAEKYFDGADVQMMMSDPRTVSYLATYYAATGDVPKTLDMLKMVYASDPNRLLMWLKVADDFQLVDKQVSFREMKTKWEQQSAEKEKKPKRSSKKKAKKKKRK